jgi:hypothetical protein
MSIGRPLIIEDEQDPLSFVGCRFGRLLVTRAAAPSHDCNCPRWRAMCDCGIGCDVTEYGLVNGLRASCGCQGQAKDRRAKVAA